ncbi:MAG TPA: MFS transporter [Gemmatimonadales bacterium]|nr:MFS transporter [Gemmatimonadales bacterium]
MTARRWSERLGLHRPELRAWALYDWAYSAMITTITTAVFPIYFVKVAARDVAGPAATARLAWVSGVALAVAAVVSPVLGALADQAPIKRRGLGICMVLGVAATAGLWWVGPGDLTLASWLFAAVIVGGTASFVFYEALLPHLARPDEIDRVSTAGYALGYVGGGTLLALNLAWILRPALFGLPTGPGLSPAQATLPTRLAFLSVAVWWLGFGALAIRRLPEPAVRQAHPGTGSAVRAAMAQLAHTARLLRQYPQAGLLLLAFLIYNDGIQTIIKMATAYGTEIGIGQGALIGSILLVQFVGIPCAFLFGALADRIGTKPAILLGLAVYGVISVFGYYMRTGTHFLILALLVGTVQGGTQALSRSLFATLIPAERSGEFFGLFSVFEKVAGIFGPLFFAAAIWISGSSRNAILSVIAFFVVGALLLGRLDVEGGRRQAREPAGT